MVSAFLLVDSQSKGQCSVCTVVELDGPVDIVIRGQDRGRSSMVIESCGTVVVPEGMCQACTDILSSWLAVFSHIVAMIMMV